MSAKKTTKHPSARKAEKKIVYFDTTINLSNGTPLRVRFDNQEISERVGDVLRGLMASRQLVWPDRLVNEAEPQKISQIAHLHDMIRDAYGRYNARLTSGTEQPKHSGQVIPLPNVTEKKGGRKQMSVPSLEERNSMAINAMNNFFHGAVLSAISVGILSDNIVETDIGLAFIEGVNWQFAEDEIVVDTDEHGNTVYKLPFDEKEWDRQIVRNDSLGAPQIVLSNDAEIRVAMVNSLVDGDEKFFEQLEVFMKRAGEIINEGNFLGGLSEIAGSPDANSIGLKSGTDGIGVVVNPEPVSREGETTD
jgi:hypothetical protein